MINYLKRNWQIILIFILGLSISWPLFKSGYFSHQDDLQIIRLVEMRKCFSDFQIPCRWVPDMGWGNGYPLFNFYGVSTYYFGALISYLVGYLISAKILFFISLTAGSLGMYLLVKELWGKYAGLTSAVLYMFAPYKALDIYVRGALGEGMALTIIPFVLYFLIRKKYFLFSLTFFLFLITHNIMTVIFVPIVGLLAVYLLLTSNLKNLKVITISFFIAFGLSAFFTIPAFIEKDLVQTESLTRFELDYRANFVGLRQLFLDRSWGYGTSIPGPEGGMNFQVGWPYWILAVLSLIFIFLNRVKKHNIILVVSIFVLFLMSVFMTHNKSTFIWESFSILKYFQFPWRFLSLSILTASILGGFVVFLVNDKWKKYLSVFIIIITILLNWGYFRPKEFYPISESQKVSGELWEQQTRGALLDYLPETALEPREKAPDLPLIITGEAEIDNYINRSNSFNFNIEVLDKTEIHMPIFYFPNWSVKVNGVKHPISDDNLLGRISISLDKGNYEVEGRFNNTPVRAVSNLISIISFVGLIVLWKKRKQ